jgi:hypothetical protein
MCHYSANKIKILFKPKRAKRDNELLTKNTWSWSCSISMKRSWNISMKKMWKNIRHYNNALPTVKVELFTL